MQNGIDIVIPIYNGYEDIQLCMDSIKKYTDLKKNRILLILSTIRNGFTRWGAWIKTPRG